MTDGSTKMAKRVFGEFTRNKILSSFYQQQFDLFLVHLSIQHIQPIQLSGGIRFSPVAILKCLKIVTTIEENMSSIGIGERSAAL